MPDEPDPPRKFYGFKPREFEKANVPPAPPTIAPLTPAASAPAPDPGSVSRASARIDVRDLNRLAATGQPLLNHGPAAVRENEIHGVLRANLAVADVAGLNEVKIDPRHRTPHQRRVRFFWMALIAVNVPLGAFAWWIGHTMAIPFASAIAAMGFLTGRLIWHTFFLNTD